MAERLLVNFVYCHRWGTRSRPFRVRHGRARRRHLWSALAGNSWPEYYFNPGVPVYSVLPDVARFPCFSQLGPDPAPVEDDGPRAPSMCRARIEADLDETARRRANTDPAAMDFDTAMRDHLRRLVALHDGHTERIWSVDNVHRAYLTDPR